MIFLFPEPFAFEVDNRGRRLVYRPGAGGLMPDTDPDFVSPTAPPLAASQSECRFSREALRAMPYGDYLRTLHWRVVRKAAIYRAGFQCQRCHEPTRHFEVHHVSYANLGDEADDDLMAVCRGCHETLHAIPVAS
jgi:5-methylcytosine-specific restriction endonuclease McrA